VGLLKFSEFVNESKGLQENNDIDQLNESLGMGQIWMAIKMWINKLWNSDKSKKTQVKQGPPIYLTGPHINYIPHQQGPSGAAEIILAAQGKGKLKPQTRNNILGNVATGSPYYNTIKDPKKSDKEAAIAFLKYYSDNWQKLQKEALSLINLPKYKKVKKAIESIKDPQLPKDFLVTVAFKESSLNPNPGTTKFKGLFQIGPSAWAELKRVLPSKYKGSVIPMDPIKNAQAGHDYLKLTNEQFEKKIKN
jgi:hypothetical protein